MKTQLKVIKADGGIEQYLHTKVIGTISKAIEQVGFGDIYITEELAGVVTYYLYHKQDKTTITSSEILSIVKVVLTATGYEDVAITLNDYHFHRKLQRKRIEVVSIDVSELADAELICHSPNLRIGWNKSVIVNDLVQKHDLCYLTARTIASMVEEKILNMTVTLVSTSLIKQLVLADTAAVLRAQQQLQAT